MENALAKTASLFLLILVGFLLRKKIATKEAKTGIKTIILSVALPAMIFIGLQKITFSPGMLAFPVLVLVFNLLGFWLAGVFARWFKIGNDPAQTRTIKMLFASLAPGLSCFPFLLEYFGESTLANAAIADIGNKFFVLIVLYMVALKWHYADLGKSGQASQQGKITSLLTSLVREPVNLVIITALTLLALGINYTQFPAFIKLTVDRASMIMTPLILIFIGISVKLKWQQFRLIASILLCRSGFAFLFSGLIIIVFNVTTPALAMLAVLFFQSSCSFWPYAHMASMNHLNHRHGLPESFELGLAMNVLALSLPFSTMLVLGLATVGEAAAQPGLVLGMGCAMMALGLVPMVANRLISKGEAHMAMAHTLTDINEKSVKA